MNKLLTIVVPVYKVEPYINKCLDSCILEDEKLLSRLEVIIVNDGTPDNSAEMSREYVKRYPNTFRQIDKENGGHGSAWNVGLKEATGKYLRFLDSDDWLTNLDKLMVVLAKTDADLVFTQLEKFMVESGEYVPFPVRGEFNKEMPIQEYDYIAAQNYTICNFQYCTYKTSLLKPYQPLFDEHIFYDDMILFVAPQLLAKSLYICDFVLYNYLKGREGQTMDPAVQVRNKRFMVQEFNKMLAFYHQHESTTLVPAWGQYVIMTYATLHFLTPLVHMPYRQSKVEATRLKSELASMTQGNPGKQTKRFLTYPYFLYYLIEKVRCFKNRK